jgi:GxxExxY protein
MTDPLDPLTQEIIGAAIDVSRGIGPGLRESAYEACLAHEFMARGLSFERQKRVPLLYKGTLVDCAYRMDFVVNDQVIVEVKAVESFTGLHAAQVLTYLRLYERRVGLLFNFNVTNLVREGLRRFVNGYHAERK